MLCYVQIMEVLKMLMYVFKPAIYIIIIIIIIIITFMQGIYKYIPETNHVSRVYSVADLMYLQFLLYVMLVHILNVLCFNVGTCRSTCAVCSVQCAVCSVQCPVRLFVVVHRLRAFL
jgi:hypothetical protein